MIKIDVHLRKLSRKQNWGTAFLDDPVYMTVYEENNSRKETLQIH